MKQHTLRKQNIDIRMLLRYFTIFLSFLVVCIVLLEVYAYHSRKQLQANAECLAQDSLTSGIDRLEVMLDEYLNAGYVIQNGTGIAQGLYDGKLTSGAGIYHISKSRDSIKDILFYTTSQDSALMTGIIINEGLVFNYLSSNQSNSMRVYLTPFDLYGKYFICEDCKSFQDWLSILKNSSNLSLLPKRNYIVNTNEQLDLSTDVTGDEYLTFRAVTFIVRLPVNSNQQPFLLYALLDSDKLIEMLVPISGIEQYHISLTDSNGIEILSYGDEDISNPVTVSVKSKSFGLMTTLTIDSHMLFADLSAFNRSVLQFGLIFLGIGLLMSVLFAWNSYKPLGNILDAVHMLDPNFDNADTSSKRNMHQYITAVLNSSGISLHAYETELKRQSSELNYLTFYHLLESDDLPTVSVLPEGIENCYLLYIRLKSAIEDNETRDSLLRLAVPIVRQILPQGEGGCAYIIRRAIVVLHPAPENDLKREKLVHGIENELSSIGNILCKLIVSETCPISLVREVYHQLQNQAKYVSYKHYAFVYFSRDIIPAHYSINEQVEHISVVRVYSMIMQSQDAVICRFLDEILQTIASDGIADETSIRYICTTFSAAISRVIQETGIQLNMNFEIPVYHADFDLSELFEHIKRSVSELSGKLNETNAAVQEQFDKNVLQYVHDNVSNPDLCITAITEQFNISANELQRIIRNAYGKSFLQYIEGYRMKMAHTLICESNITIREVSEKCGYSSQNSFYKAYKRYYGNSPGSIRTLTEKS